MTVTPQATTAQYQQTVRRPLREVTGNNIRLRRAAAIGSAQTMNPISIICAALSVASYVMGHIDQAVYMVLMAICMKDNK